MFYQLPNGCFVEVNYDVDKNEVTFLFPFEAGGENDRLEDYAMFVKLPEWLTPTRNLAQHHIALPGAILNHSLS